MVLLHGVFVELGSFLKAFFGISFDFFSASSANPSLEFCVEVWTHMQ